MFRLRGGVATVRWIVLALIAFPVIGTGCIPMFAGSNYSTGINVDNGGFPTWPANNSMTFIANGHLKKDDCPEQVIFYAAEAGSFKLPQIGVVKPSTAIEGEKCLFEGQLTHTFSGATPGTSRTVKVQAEVQQGFGSGLGHYDITIETPAGYVPPPVPPNPDPDPAPLFLPTKTIGPVQESPSAIVVADLLTGGRPEIAVADDVGIGNDVTRIYSRDGTGKFGVFGNTFTIGDDPRALAPLDFDLDGDLDLAFADFDVSDDNPPAGPDEVRVRYNVGGLFDQPAPGGTLGFQVGAGPVDLATINLGDGGTPALVSANAIAGTIDVISYNTARPPGTELSQTSYPTGGAGPQAVAAADFNLDGRSDIAVVNGDNTGTVAILRQTATTTADFAAAQSVLNAGTDTPGLIPRGLAVGNLNPDNLPDIVIANQAGSSIMVLLNTTPTGSSTFSFSRAFYPSSGDPAGRFPNDVAIGDFDRDGKLDVATANKSSDANASVYLGDGTGAFPAAPLHLPMGNRPERIAVGDINNDFRDDIATANVDSTAGTGSLTIAVSNLGAALDPAVAGAVSGSTAGREPGAGAAPRARGGGLVAVTKFKPVKVVREGKFSYDDTGLATFSGSRMKGPLRVTLRGPDSELDRLPAELRRPLVFDAATEVDGQIFPVAEGRPLAVKGLVAGSVRDHPEISICARLSGAQELGAPGRFRLLAATGALSHFTGKGKFEQLQLDENDLPDRIRIPLKTRRPAKFPAACTKLLP